MMRKRHNLTSESQSVTSPELLLIRRPHWLLAGSYGSPRWVVCDDNPRSPQGSMVIRFDVPIYDPRRPGEICLLTDPEYAHLLNTIQRVGYGIRIGKYATVTTAAAQDTVVRHLINFVAWMLYNDIRRFEYLCQADFDSYVERAIYGPSHLLEYVARIRQHVAALKEANTEIPSYRTNTSKSFLDTKKLLKGAGLSHHRVRSNKVASYELVRIRQEEGLYLSPNQLKRLSGKPPEPLRLSFNPMRGMLLPWFLLWLMRNELSDDQLQFNPFEHTSMDEKAQELATPVGRTKTAPVLQTMELIDFSIRWVLDYATPLLDIRDRYEKVAEKYHDQYPRFKHLAQLISEAGIPEGPGSPSSLTPSTKFRTLEKVDLTTAVNKFIPAACLIVICAFSGRRHKEALSIRAEGPHNADCLSRDEQGWLIEIYIEKTLQDWDKTPCNELVVAAVEILRRWSAPARAISKDVNLFQFRSFRSNKAVRFRVAYSLHLFVSFLSITPLPDGNLWKFTPQQFRRFFAIMYFWRYQYGNLAALSYHLRHFNPAMTQRYVTEPDSGAIFRHINKDYTTTILTEAAIGERNISGPFGERFKAVARKLRQHYRRTVKVVSPKLVRKVVERFVLKSGRRLKAMLWGYCFCGTLPHQLKTARCLENSPTEIRGGPDFSQSSPSICAGCPHHLSELIFEPFIRTDLAAHERAAADPDNGPLVRDASRRRTEELRQHYDRSFKNSRPLEVLNA
jgi:hypothetical protein